ncbi:uncharacterized protein LOC127266283 isoform X2 [Andrographis paniculata]|uniref:uncharacterized protein LOC127266283 isoform X2 n=1 Tax=Andrographis paniculata TaxID=175694 RepID=UPI0021E88CF0|nr:uncharacterized protein LOC127266283 isoform X2 [Andrographis paniculata]XP_051152484.1 uncharacterized protein LOC127266283 isoform X2 [Andrographis paniculata]XP_051152491.1 uncharacterized protein LOC127266283 isoform X2 [Andrographis paniculata]XP_051152498.1 uncharacterized protein LOC127266283 isoform X2 [Andrographis paniculata]
MILIVILRPMLTTQLMMTFATQQEASKAQWVQELGMAEVLEKKGKMWITTGIVRDGKTYLSMEETLYLAEIGALNVIGVDGTQLPLNDLYGKVAEDKNRHGCSWESFEVFRHLKFLGYIVGRHGVPWTIKKFKIKIDDREDITEHGNGKEQVLEDNHFIIKHFSNLHLDEKRPIFDVYSPNSKFKKSAPGAPSFHLCLSSGQPPSKKEIEDLEAHYNGCPVKFCTVEHGRVSFFSFDQVELPILP